MNAKKCVECGKVVENSDFEIDCVIGHGIYQSVVSRCPNCHYLLEEDFVDVYKCSVCSSWFEEQEVTIIGNKVFCNKCAKGTNRRYTKLYCLLTAIILYVTFIDPIGMTFKKRIIIAVSTILIHIVLNLINSSR